MTTTPELKPCPFCGDESDAEPRNYGTGAWHVLCSHCGVSLPANHATEDAAIAAWNRRAPSEGRLEYEQELERVRDDIDMPTRIRDSAAIAIERLAALPSPVSGPTDTERLDWYAASDNADKVFFGQFSGRWATLDSRGEPVLHPGLRKAIDAVRRPKEAP